MKNQPIVIAIDGTSASGKSTAARLAAKTLHYAYVDTGAMYRALAWYCVKSRVDVNDPAAVARACRRWKTTLVCEEGPARRSASWSAAIFRKRKSARRKSPSPLPTSPPSPRSASG